MQHDDYGHSGSPMILPARWYRSKWGIAVLAGLLVAAGFGLRSAYEELQVYRAAQAALDAIDRRDYDQAIAHLDYCLSVYPRSGQYHFDKARALIRAGQLRQGEESLRAAEKYQWVPEAIQMERMLIQAKSGNLEGVENYLFSAVEADHPEKKFLIETLAQVSYTQYAIARALRYTQRWLELEPNRAEVYAFHGEVLDRLRIIGSTIEAYRKAVELAPKRVDYRHRLGELLLQGNLPREAVAEFDRLLALLDQDPELPPRTPSGSVDSPEAIRSLYRQLALLGKGRALLELGEPAAAKELIDTYLRTHPNDPIALASRGQAELDLGNLQQAVEWYRRSMRKPPYELDRVYSFVRALELAKLDDEAKLWREKRDRLDADLKRLAHLARTIALSDGEPDLRVEAGEILLRNAMEAEGVRWIESALRFDPLHEAAHRTLAAYYAQNNQPEEASYHRKAAEFAARQKAAQAKARP